MFKATPQTLDLSQLQALAALARLELSATEAPALQESINQILSMVADLAPATTQANFMPDETLSYVELQALAFDPTQPNTQTVESGYLAEIAPAWSDSCLVVPEVIDQTVAHQKTEVSAS